MYPFTKVFREVNRGEGVMKGVLSEEECREMIGKMGIAESEEEIRYVLGVVDPFNNQKMTYSELVHHFSSHQVPSNNSKTKITIMEKFHLLN